jgi:hypothetical protein
MATHRKKPRRVKAAGGVEETDVNAANPNPASAKVHSFSRTVAKEHGEKAAVLLQYLAHHVSKSKHSHGGRKWSYRTLDWCRQT